MSRTFHHGTKAKVRKFGEVSWADNRDGPKRKRESHRSEMLPTPSWWIREMMTRPQRAAVRDLIAKIDIQEPALFPLAKKPHLYFW